jgi:hypothetical protein
MKDIIHAYLSARQARGFAIKDDPFNLCVRPPKNNALARLAWRIALARLLVPIPLSGPHE